MARYLEWPEGWPRTPGCKRTYDPMRKPLLAMAESIYRAKVPAAHPDRGGSNDAMFELSQAIEQCRAALGQEGA